MTTQELAKAQANFDINSATLEELEEASALAHLFATRVDNAISKRKHTLTHSLTSLQER